MSEHDVSFTSFELAANHGANTYANHFETAGFLYGPLETGTDIGVNGGEPCHDHRGTAAPVSDVSEQAVPVKGGMVASRAKNRNACGKCQLDRKKCSRISGIPFLCHRCKAKGRPICPPHVNYANLRKQFACARLAQTQAVSELYTFVYENM